jgi:hypothetical protein
MPITTAVVSSNPVRDEVYSIQHYVIKFVSDLWFSPGTPVSSTSKTDRHDITEILLKVVLNTLNQPTNCLLLWFYFTSFSLLWETRGNSNRLSVYLNSIQFTQAEKNITTCIRREYIFISV